MDEAKKSGNSPFSFDAKFIEMDATCVRFDERNIADPLLGSVHDPIYQGAGAFGAAGIPQPKPGAVTKAHGGVLFLDEIGEIHPIQMNKLLKVLEDRRVFFESAYYNSEDKNIPSHIHDIFKNGLPADFRLVGATTKSPMEISPAIRSRCIEIFFRPLYPDEIVKIAIKAAKKSDMEIEDSAAILVGAYATNGRDAVNIVQLAGGVAAGEGRSLITEEHIQWVVDTGHYQPRPEKYIKSTATVGRINGLAVYGANMGMVIEIEAVAIKAENSSGLLTITGFIDEEELDGANRRVKRKSTAKSSVDNVLTVLKKYFNINTNQFDIHINVPGGTPMDGPSAGITIACAVYSAITGRLPDPKATMTGELSINGEVMPIGGVKAKIGAAQKAGAQTVIIPKENAKEAGKVAGIDIICVSSICEVFEIVFFGKRKSITVPEIPASVLSAQPMS
jgi:Lon-like ATP-dependent protease